MQGSLLTICIIFISIYVNAQGGDSTLRDQLSDTTRPDLITRLKIVAEKAAKKSQTKLKENQIAARQDHLFNELGKVSEAAELYVDTGIDSTGIRKELEDIKNWYAIVGDGIFTNRGTAQTHRNLATSTSILRELLNRTTIRKGQVDRYRRSLVGFRDAIDSLASDTSLYKFSSDSAVLISYIDRLAILASEVGPTDSILKRAIASIEGLQMDVSQLENLLKTGLDEIENYRLQLSEKIFQREFTNLWEPSRFHRPFGQIINYAVAKVKLILEFYSVNNKGKIFFIVLLIVALFLFLKSLKEKIKDQNLSQEGFEGRLILRYPLLSSIMIILNLFQFIFPAPPFVLSCVIWLISSVCLTLIFRDYISRFWFRNWTILFFFFVLACADNLVLQASRTERWFIFFLSLAGLVHGTAALVRGRKNELKEKRVIYFVGFVVLLEFVAFVANIFGRYNLSKTFMTSGFFSVVIAILFLWTVKLIREGLAIAKEVYKGKEAGSVYINFERVGEKVHPLFKALLIAGWLILFGRNFYVFRLITEPLKKFFTEDRTIGSYSFNISSVLVFFLIMSLSVITSKLVSFFASDARIGPAGNERRAGLGSWILLVRITIISLGLFLAVAATGAPVDRITIILGALSVGIGLGLQGLVNNLVSGLIIAFEKPVNVGDSVEIGGRSGMIKSIGFRSSILSTVDGAEVIIPNGDLLNAHLVNWTLGNRMRRGDLLIGIAFGTDLEKARKILEELMAADKRILRYPPSFVLFQQFNSSSIDVKLFFWSVLIDELGSIKSDLIAAIDRAFKENGIEIPYPQQELYIRTATEPTSSDAGVVHTKQ